MSALVTAAVDFVTNDRIAVTTAARVLGASLQAVYDRSAPARQAGGGVVPRLLPPVLPENWLTMSLGPGECDVETAIHVWPGGA